MYVTSPHVGRREWVVAWLLLGAALQLGGILVVLLELRMSRREADRLGDAVSWAAYEKLGPVLRRTLQASPWRIVGVVLLVLGVLLTTMGGVWALYLAPVT
jgi:drug/metabolite transporter (DMT)-like permease